MCSATSSVNTKNCIAYLPSISIRASSFEYKKYDTLLILLAPKFDYSSSTYKRVLCKISVQLGYKNVILKISKFHILHLGSLLDFVVLWVR